MNFSYLGVAIYDDKAQEVRLASYSESGASTRSSERGLFT